MRLSPVASLLKPTRPAGRSARSARRGTGPPARERSPPVPGRCRMAPPRACVCRACPLACLCLRLSPLAGRTRRCARVCAARGLLRLRRVLAARACLRRVGRARSRLRTAWHGPHSQVWARPGHAVPHGEQSRAARPRARGVPQRANRGHCGAMGRATSGGGVAWAGHRQRRGAQGTLRVLSGYSQDTLRRSWTTASASRRAGES